MNEIDFLMNGRRLRLTTRQVIERMHGEQPEPIQTWAVEVNGKWFPVKQVLATATGEERQTFVSHRARDLLRRLGLRVADIQAEGGLPPAAGSVVEGEPAASADGDAIGRRLEVLSLALQHCSVRKDADLSHVLEVAETLDAWVARPS